MLLRVVAASIAVLVGGLLPLTVGWAASGTWTTTGSMAVARVDAVAASLPDGDVLVAGGGGCGAALASAEIYHASGPAAGTWTSAGSMSVGRYMATATVLGDGKVLVAGGVTSACTPTAAAELYDRASNSWTVTGSMQFARSSFTATRIADQLVVVSGGFGDAGVSLTTEEYSETSSTWARLANMNVGRQEHAAVALPSSGPAAVMVIGGNTGAGITTSVEIGEKLPGAAAFSWAQAPSINISRDDFTATLLSAGNVLAAGGASNSGFDQATAELWGPAWTQVANMGYVATGFGSRAAAEIKRDIDTYYAWYDVDGIFLDEASTDCAVEPAYADLNTYVKAKGGIARTVLNPGTQTGECYMAAADIVVTFEGTSSSYLASYSAPSWLANYPASRFWHLVYATPTDQQMRNVVSLSKTRRAGWIYVTPDDLPNPWDTLPAEAYWSDELAAALQDPSLAAPAPTLGSSAPTSAQIQPATGSGQPVTLTGTGFTPSSVVQWKRSTDAAPTVLPTTFVSSNQLTATIPASSLSATGAAEISVVTPAPGGGSSAPQPFFVTATTASLAGPPVSQIGTSPTSTVRVSTNQSPPGTADTVSASATGSGTLTLAQYTADPQTVTPTGGATNYFDVHVASGSSFSTVTVVDCNLTGAPADPGYGIVLWWNGTGWTPGLESDTKLAQRWLHHDQPESNLRAIGRSACRDGVRRGRRPHATDRDLRGQQRHIWRPGHRPRGLCRRRQRRWLGGASTTCKDVIAPAYTFTPGINSFSATATDRAGNVATGSFSFILKVTASDLCTLTTRFVQGSAKYQALPPGDRAALDLATAALCQHVASAPNPTPTQKARLIAAYQAGVAALVPPGWLTQQQSATLVELSMGL